MIRIASTLLAALAAAFMSVAAIAADDGPVAFVQGLYAVALKSYANPKSPDVVNDKAMRKRFFAASLAKALQKDEDDAARAGEVGNLDFDPVSNSQDPQVKDVRVTLASADAGKAVVDVAFSNGGSPQALVYTLVVEGGHWRVDDISQPGSDGWSLRAILKGQ